MDRKKAIFSNECKKERIRVVIQTQDEVVLRNFSIPNLLWQGVLTVIHISEKSKGGEAVSYFRCVVFLLNHGDNDQHSPSPPKKKNV